jgi:MFS transporter, DHA1 family, multidrug resistance protein
MYIESKNKVNHTAIILVLAMLTAFAPFATDMYLPGFAAMAETLNTSTPSLQLSLSIFFLGLAVGQLLYGPIADRWGRKIPLMAGIAIFCIASALIMFTTNYELFIVLRFIQSIGGAAGMVMSRVIIQDLFDQKKSAQALSTMMVMQGIGPVLAPISGGFLISHFAWQSVFLLLSVFSFFCLYTTLRYIPETLVYNEKENTSVNDIVRQFINILKVKAFLIPCLIGSLAVSVMFTFIAVSPDLFMKIYQLNETQYGFAFGSIACGIVVFSQINRLLLSHYTLTQILKMSMISSIIFSVLLMLSLSSSLLIYTMIPLFFCVGMVPLIAANSTALAMSVFPDNAGPASSLVGVMQFGLGFIFSTLPGLFGNNNTIVMGIVIVGCFSLSLMLFALLPSAVNNTHKFK